MLPQSKINTVSIHKALPTMETHLQTRDGRANTVQQQRDPILPFDVNNAVWSIEFNDATARHFYSTSPFTRVRPLGELDPTVRQVKSLKLRN